MKPTNPYFENLSRQRITEALLTLMKQYSFKEITILQITQEAGVARRTFYLYYSSPSDVLDQYYDVLLREYEDEVEADSRTNFRRQTEYFFFFWHRHTDYLKLLYDQKLFHILMARFTGYLHTLNALSAKAGDKYLVPYISGGLWAALFTWTENDFADSPDYVAKEVLRFQNISPARQ